MADNVRFLLSSKIGKEGIHKDKSEIIIKIYLTREIRVQVKTGIFINPKNYSDSETGIVVPKLGRLNIKERKEAIDAKQTLDAFTLRLTTIKDALENGNVPINRDLFLESIAILDRHSITTESITVDILDELKQQEKMEAEVEDEKHSETFLETIEAFLKSKDATANYRKHFMVTVRCMLRYECYCKLVVKKKEAFTWDINKVSREDIEDFVSYLKREDEIAEQNPKIFKKILKEVDDQAGNKYKSHMVKGRGSNTIVKLEKHIKQFFKWCVETGRSNNQPFTGITIGSEHFGTPYYITIEERNHIADFDFSNKPHLEVQRDIFIFQCLVGCRFGDLIKLTPANVSNDILEYVPTKTKDDAQPVKPRVPLNARARKLIEKYKGKDSQGRLFPFISNQKYNDAIKEIFEIAGVVRIVQVRNAKTDEIELVPINNVASSHMARRTFVGAAYKKVKDPNLVGKMSGHVEGSKAFARYRDIDDDDLRSVIDMID